MNNNLIKIQRGPSICRDNLKVVGSDEGPMKGFASYTSSNMTTERLHNLLNEVADKAYEAGLKDAK